MVKSIIIISDQSPIGNNSTAESIRMGSGLTAYGGIDVKIVFRGDAVLFLNKNLKPEAINMDSIVPILRLMELADIEIYVLEGSLERAGLTRSELIPYENLKVIKEKDLANLILKAEASFRF